MSIPYPRCHLYLFLFIHVYIGGIMLGSGGIVSRWLFRASVSIFMSWLVGCVAVELCLGVRIGVRVKVKVKVKAKA